jgi:hypothetical protein
VLPFFNWEVGRLEPHLQLPGLGAPEASARVSSGSTRRADLEKHPFPALQLMRRHHPLAGHSVQASPRRSRITTSVFPWRSSSRAPPLALAHSQSQMRPLTFAMPYRCPALRSPSRCVTPVSKKPRSHFLVPTFSPTTMLAYAGREPSAAPDVTTARQSRRRRTRRRTTAEHTGLPWVASGPVETRIA